MPDATRPSGEHWTQSFPQVAGRAAALLGVDLATVAMYNRVVPGGIHVWVPGRGGAQAIIGFDGSACVRESAFTGEELLASFHEGRRNDATISETPINHAASAVAAMVGVLRGEPGRQATPTGPSEQELAELIGAPFQQTTPDELAERLRARGKGAYSILGIDRAHGPGHWYVTFFDGNDVMLLDPIANRTVGWPPAGDVVGWWADGEPTRPPATIVLDARSRHGRRVWLRTTPGLDPLARGLVDWFAAQPPEHVTNGLGVWHGFWWSALSQDGDDLRVAATDLTKPGIETMTWDVDPMLEALHYQMEMAAFWRPHDAVSGHVRGRSREDPPTADMVHTFRRPPRCGGPLTGSRSIRGCTSTVAHVGVGVKRRRSVRWA